MTEPRISLTIEEIERVFAEHEESIAKLDPWVNGEMRAELDVAELDPNAEGLSQEERRVIIEQRTKIMNRYELTHDWCVGHRMANSTLLYRLRKVLAEEPSTV